MYLNETELIEPSVLQTTYTDLPIGRIIYIKNAGNK